MEKPKVNLAQEKYPQWLINAIIMRLASNHYSLKTYQSMRHFALMLLFSVALLASCTKDDTGTVRFSNNSSNPYELFINGESKGEFGGLTWRNFDLDAGSYTLKATQVSGYILFPTVKEGQITLKAGESLEWSFP